MAALTAAAIVLNVVGGEVVARIGLPIYGDSVGTVIAGALGGPWIGALAGASTNVLWALLGRPNVLPFAVTAAAIGLLAGLATRWGWMRSVWRAALAGLVTGVTAAIVSAPIAAWLFGGVTGAGTDLIVAFFRATGSSIQAAALGQGLVSDPIDKLATFLVAFFVLRALPQRQLWRYPGAAAIVGARGRDGGDDPAANAPWVQGER
jgi:energy-coupling factor transport system substrate-specific component